MLQLDFELVYLRGSTLFFGSFNTTLPPCRAQFEYYLSDPLIAVFNGNSPKNAVALRPNLLCYLLGLIYP